MAKNNRQQAGSQLSTAKRLALVFSGVLILGLLAFFGFGPRRVAETTNVATPMPQAPPRSPENPRSPGPPQNQPPQNQPPQNQNAEMAAVVRRHAIDEKLPELGAVGAAAAAVHHHVLRSWQGQLEPRLRELAQGMAAEGRYRFTLPLFDGEEITVSVRLVAGRTPASGSFVGQVIGEADSMVSLGFSGVAEAGSIHRPSRGRTVEVRPGPVGTTVLSELDAAAALTCAACSPDRLPNASQSQPKLNYPAAPQ